MPPGVQVAVQLTFVPVEVQPDTAHDPSRFEPTAQLTVPVGAASPLTPVPVIKMVLVTAAVDP